MAVISHHKRRFRAYARLALGLALASLVGAPLDARPSSHLRVRLESGAVATLTPERLLYLEAVPRRGEGLWSFTRRYCGSTEAVPMVAGANGEVGRLLAGVRYRIPFAALTPEYQLEVVRALFSRDFVSASGWYHQVGAGAHAGSESLWHIAEWFTGRGDNYRVIREENFLADDALRPEQLLLVPARLLRPALRAALPPDSPYYLEYRNDSQGEYAAYRLKAGEALYSSVVIRFTGRIYADDVHALAEEIAKRSGIRDVTGIPVGFEVKIPFELLLPEFLPASHPRRREYELGLLASLRYSNRVTARRLEGITVILDSGHGGRDVGASKGEVWESVYVYDILVRVRRLLKESTAARVETTIRDGRDYSIDDRDILPPSRGHQILTNPVYSISDSKVALHLRWYLANSIFRRAAKKSADADKVVFLSIHADSLHPSLRGAMAYIPGARYRGGSYGKSGPAYASRREVREAPAVSFTRQQREKSEGLSRELAHSILRGFGAQELELHPDKPVREKIIRKRTEFVPAVLRYNAVPAQALVEVCNLANAEDRRLLQTREFRQKVAVAIVAGIVDYYGEGGRASELRLASTAR